jgi:hypothetical protein
LIPAAPSSLALPPSSPAATAPSAPTLRRWWGKKKWAIILGCGALAAILLGFLVVGVKVLFPSRGAVDGAPVLTQPRDKTAPLTAEEERVRRYVLDNADDAESVEFVLWGPSASRATLKKLWEDASARYDERIREQGAAAKAKEVPSANPFRRALSAKASGVVRLRYRAKNRLGAKVLVDLLFILFEDGTIIPIENPSGDKWAESENGTAGRADETPSRIG